MKCDTKIFKISWTEPRTNKSVKRLSIEYCNGRDELKMDDQWLEIFTNKQLKAEVFILAQDAVLIKRTVLWMEMTRDCRENERESGINTPFLILLV